MYSERKEIEERYNAQKEALYAQIKKIETKIKNLDEECRIECDELIEKCDHLEQSVCRLPNIKLIKQGTGYIVKCINCHKIFDSSEVRAYIEPLREDN
jgi:DNA repair exonuclease SbcCD ATPase subunit